MKMVASDLSYCLARDSCRYSIFIPSCSLFIYFIFVNPSSLHRPCHSKYVFKFELIHVHIRVHNHGYNHIHADDYNLVQKSRRWI